MAKTIFITGGTGFVGSHILRYLVRDHNHKVKALKRPNSPMSLVEEVKDKVEWIEGDLLDTVSLEDAMQDVDEVYHCGALISFEPKLFDRMQRINQEGTANVVNIALHFSIKKLVYLSSIAALGRYEKVRHYDEKTKWDRSPLNSRYAISKYMAEQEVWRGIAEGLNAAIVNPSVILGSGIWGSGTTTFFKQVWKGLRFYPTGATGFVDVRDVAKFAIQLMESEVSAQRFVLNSENWSYLQLFTEIAKAFGKNPPTIKSNNLMTAAAWRGDWLLSKISGKSRLITKEIAVHISSNYTYGNEKSQAFYNDKYTPIQQTLIETCQQFVACQQENLTATVLPLI